MKIYREKIELISKDNQISYFDITDNVQAVINNSGIQMGIVSVVTPHTTCAVFYEEFVHDIDEDGFEFLQKDLNDVLDKMIPPHKSSETYLYPGEAHYQAVAEWPNIEEYMPNGDQSALWNGDAHLRATLIGSSELLDVENGKLGVGKTGYIYYVDFDRNRSRRRTCSITVIGA